MDKILLISDEDSHFDQNEIFHLVKFEYSNDPLLLLLGYQYRFK